MSMGYNFHIQIAPDREPLNRLVRTTQMASVGNFLSMWNNAELLMELVIQRELGLTLEQTCVICAPLGGGAKTELLIGLFKGSDQLAPFVQAVRDLQQHVSRNWLAHGFITFDDWNGPWEIVTGR